MGKYTEYSFSTGPRLGGAKKMAELMAAQASTMPPAPTTSIATHPQMEPNRLENMDFDPTTGNTTRNKRRRVMIEDMPEDNPAFLPFRHSPPPRQPSLPTPGQPAPSNLPPTTHTRLYRYKGLHVEEFPEPLAGAPISNERKPPPDLGAYMRRCGPMADPNHFEAAELLMTSGMSNANKDRHLKSKKYVGATPWSHCNAMLDDVDNLAHGPEFEQSEIEIFDGRRPRPQFMVFRDLIEIIKDFLSNSAFKSHMRYAPWRLYTSASKTERVYADMAASDWWWREMEKLVEQGYRDATIVPLIIATDQTTLSIMCGGQKAYPVYVTFGNLDKDWRRKPSKHGMYLLGYLPVDAFEDVPNDDERRRLKAELVHRAMEKMLSPLRTASEQGVEMWCPDGRLRRIFPRIAAYTADWPEQSLQCCTSEGGCPICKTEHKGRGNLDSEVELREREETLQALRAYILTQNKHHLKLLGLKEVWPWWGDIPDVNLSTCIAPDLLHQAYQGLFKTHLVRWMKEIIGVDKLDDWFAAMPRAEGLAHYPNGISAISNNRWTGSVSKQLLAQFLPTVVGPLEPDSREMVRALVDFMYRAHAPSLTESDLNAMDDDLRIFHRHKNLLVGPVYEEADHFDKIPKLHMLRHWTYLIRELGTPDGYNTEAPEHLHIEYAKVPWRASNKVRPLPQMVTYIQRQEAIRVHRALLDQYIRRDQDNVDGADEVDLEDVVAHEVCGNVDMETTRDGGNAQPPNDTADVEDLAPEVYYPNPSRRMAKTPTVKRLPIQNVIDDYLASDFISATTDFLTRRCRVAPHDILISPRNEVSIWHRLHLYHNPPSFAPFDPVRRDVVRACASRPREPAVWDVALYLEKPSRPRSDKDVDEKHGLHRYRPGRVRTFFKLPAHLQFYYPGQLAYLELFAPFDAQPSPFTKLHSTKLDFDSRDLRRTLVIPVSEIIFACHLVPKFHKLPPELELHAYSDLLAAGRTFWLNHYYNHHFYRLIQHWRRLRPGLRQRLIQHSQRSQPHE
ncbi:unnamed protein product [Rhizoctonia solani]|uniref:Uncharacterized protein n=1 Tax=Rhizoctonia solani TaxID=456999 RepID=A0A8H3I410_9AGAM|nr:unnamed protein product [Rhizoctonia solani]